MKLVSTSARSRAVTEAASNEKTPRGFGGRPSGGDNDFPRTEREKLIDVFASTLLAAVVTARARCAGEEAGFDVVAMRRPLAVAPRCHFRSFSISAHGLAFRI